MLVETMSSSIDVYTDGSCNPEYEVGAWAAILFINDEKLVLSATVEDTTHQRMELTAVIKAFEYLTQINVLEPSIRVFTDSQYVVDIPRRSAGLIAKSFLTKSGQPVHNADLLQELISFIEKLKPIFVKLKAHQREVSSTNQEVDRLSRKLVRERVNQNKLK